MKLFTPNAVLDKKSVQILVWGQIIVAVLIWTFSPSPLLPKPGEVLSAFSDLWEQGLGAEMLTSFYLNVEAIALAMLLSLALSYATVMPFFRPIVALLSKLRFLSPVGLTFVFTLVATNGHSLKLSILVFVISIFFVTSMADVLNSIPKEQFDLARCLHMGEWRVVWEVIILGQFDKVFDALRQNAAMGWTMLTLVESMVRSEGGVGTILMDQNHHFRLPAVFAIQICITALGVGQDYAIGIMKRFVCPYAFLTVEAR